MPLSEKERLELLLKIRFAEDPCRRMELTPCQKLASESKARYVAIRGANRCLGGEQEIYDPVLGELRRVDSIESDFHVLAWDGKSLVVAEAERPFTKPVGQIWEWTFSDGSTLVASPEHVLLCADRTWRSLAAIAESSLPVPLLSPSASVPASARSCESFDLSAQGFQDDCRRRLRSCDEQFHATQECGQDGAPSQSGARRHTNGAHRSHADALASRASNTSPACSARPSSMGVFRHRQTRACAEAGQESFDIPNIGAWLSPGQTISGPDTRRQSASSSGSQFLRQSECAALASLAPLLLTRCRYIRDDIKWDFTVPRHHNYVAGGVINHNSGKTAYSAYRLARIARRLPDPKTTKIQGVYVVFCPSRSQIQDPWGKKLLKASEVKGELFDRPFIPPYEIKNIWYTYGAGDKTPSLIELKNGNYILFCVSGDKNVWKRIEGKGYVLGVVLDESAGTDELLTELSVRLLDANSNDQVKREAGGAWILWGATQTKKSPAFERFLALGQSGADPDYAAFDLLPGENPAIDQAEREKLATIMSKESYEVRMLGHGSAASNMALYPQWDDDINLVPKGQEYEPGLTDNLWIFYDPGTHYTGIVFAAINRLYPNRLNIVRFEQTQRTTLEYDVKLIRDWLGGRWLEGFVYDQAARKMDKTGSTVAGALWKLFNTKGHDIRMHRGMLMGKSEYALTVPLMRSCIRCPAGSDIPTNLILNRESGCGLLRWQIMNCAFKENAYDLKESNIAEGNDHGSDALRYGISRRPAWVDRGNNPKLWGDGIAEDPDADRQNLKDLTPGDAQFQFTPQTGEAVDPAARQRRKEAANREKRLKQSRSIW